MLGGLALLVADVYAVIKTLQSNSDGLAKLIWVVLIVMMPILGLIIWFFAGPRPARP
ncbi:MAG: PLDc_N domain-containing protein [Gammaproteobacteria bacterium]|nr:PLDc_N domain-containing protein [Gammaproteobacteria bacterium]